MRNENREAEPASLVADAGAVDLYRAARRRINLLRLLTPSSIERDRAALTEYATTGRRVSLPWQFEPIDQTALTHLDATAARLVEQSALLAEELRHVAAGVRLAAASDAAEFQDWVQHTYGAVPGDSLHLIMHELRPARDEPDAAAADVLTATEFADMARHALQETGLSQWTIEMSPDLAPSVSTSCDHISIRSDATFTTSDARRLLLHEIGSHAIRRENANRQRLPLLRIAPIANTATEEGLAVWHEDRFGVLTPTARTVYASRVLAADIANEAGLFDVLDAVLPYLKVETAINTAIRAKRGYRDPHAPGAFTKDIAYFFGWRAVARVLHAHPADYTLLMSTKRPLAELPALRQLDCCGLVDPPAFLPVATTFCEPLE